MIVTVFCHVMYVSCVSNIHPLISDIQNLERKKDKIVKKYISNANNFCVAV